jgi:hypothetical protein
MDEQAKSALKRELLGVATQVSSRAAGKVPRLTGRAAGSVKPRASMQGASIAFGGSAAPYFPWLDFGGSTGKGHRAGAGGSGSVKRPWLGNPSGEGRYIYPTIREMRPEIETAVDDALAAAARAASFETRG